MNILALVILFLLLFYRIKSTPSNLSKTIWRKRLQKSIDKMKEQEMNDTIKGASVLIVLFMELFLIIFYAILGTCLGTTTFIVLSALQIMTCIVSTIKSLADFNTAFSTDINEHKFYRLWFLFNVVLDYIYYPMAIYILLV